MMKPVTSTMSLAVGLSVTRSRFSGQSPQPGGSACTSARRAAGARWPPASRSTTSRRSSPGATRPVGKATSMWTSAPTHRFSSSRPIVNAQSAFA